MLCGVKIKVFRSLFSEKWKIILSEIVWEPFFEHEFSSYPLKNGNLGLFFDGRTAIFSKKLTLSHLNKNHLKMMKTIKNLA